MVKFVEDDPDFANRIAALLDQWGNIVRFSDTPANRERFWQTVRTKLPADYWQEMRELMDTVEQAKTHLGFLGRL